MMRSLVITKVITIHPVGDMNVHTTSDGNLSNSCQDMSLKTTNVNAMVVVEGTASELPKTVEFIVCEPSMSV